MRPILADPFLLAFQTQTGMLWQNQRKTGGIREAGPVSPVDATGARTYTETTTHRAKTRVLCRRLHRGYLRLSWRMILRRFMRQNCR